MHDTAKFYGQMFFKTYLADRTGLTIVDIGSQDINGSLRDLSSATDKYIGVDMAPGKGVDVVLDDPHKLPFADASVDVCLSTSCLEHDQFFWLSFLEMLRVLKPGGLIYMNVPSNGYYHQAPLDHWRFYPDSGLALVNWAERNGYHPAMLESFIGRQGRYGWNDFVGVFVKDAAIAHSFPNRIQDELTSYTNGRRFGDQLVTRCSFMTEDQRSRSILNRIYRLFFRLIG